ncbi:hypothetical protein DPMN_148595 [Dreissena polymorpha]|uniref:Uncharacterized protein n=1 Tax=Dreissena polymorpha TaxID=45954 RepID=A0A9D4J1P1_DREPO|nr:hypothetical protein DPMN_148595 [Dreissena polymorpha]
MSVTKGAPGLVMGPCIVEIDCIVIKECRNEEIIVKGNFGWAWPIWAGCPRVGNGAMHIVQYQFEVNRCSYEEIIVKGNFGWVWPMWAGRPRIDRIVIWEAEKEEWKKKHDDRLKAYNRAKCIVKDGAQMLIDHKCEVRNCEIPIWLWTEGQKDGQTTPKQYPSEYGGG